VETCKEDSLGFVSQDCPGESTICEAGVCASIICDANASYCDGTTVLQCNGTGTSAEELATCDETTEACVGGACVSKICAPGDAVCNGISEVQTCNGDGLGYTSTDCGAGLACKDGDCEAQICTPNALLCDGTEVQLCDSLGIEAEVVKDCAATNKLCVDGICAELLCAPNTSYCEGNTFKKCNAGGSAATDVEDCDDSEFCSDVPGTSACNQQVCAPEELTCVGNAVETCNAEGSGSSFLVDCSSTGKWCLNGACVENKCGALSFESNTAQVMVNSTISTIRNGADSITLEAWFRPTGSTEGTIFGTSCNYFQFTVTESKTLSGWSWAGGTSCAGSDTLQIGEWNHVAFRVGFEAGTPSAVYLNGQVQCTMDTGNMSDDFNKQMIYLGGFNDACPGDITTNPVNPVEGEVSTFRISTGNSIEPGPQPSVLGVDDNTRLLYKFDDPPGETIIDLSPNGLHAVHQDTTWAPCTGEL
jgi:hypothetical protein